MKNYFYPEERIAIVGMGALLPDANNVDLFWSNILSKKVSIREVPDSILSRDIYYDRDAFGKINKKDKSYTRIVAPVDVDDYTSLSRKFKIPPAVAEHMDPNQHVAIYCVDQALQSLANSNINRERTAVIMCTGAPGIRYNNIIRRTYYEKIEHYLRNNPRLNSNFKKEELDELVQGLSNIALDGTIPITEDSAPGMLQSITAARISNLFDFYGPSYTIDAACASSLAAVISGITGLLRKDYDVLITGGVDVTLDESPFVVFSAINALSPTGSYPFDSRANGFVIGLGGGILVLKRLEDALRDNDRIYALISGFGQGSDGKGKYIAAPNEEGQFRVIKSTLEMSNYNADTIEYIEAHGTGTSVGDVVEIKALKKAFEAMGVTKKNFCGISSVKSNIGHLRYAAGSPGLIKAAMALHNKILPPTANVENINPKLGIEDSPFYILTDKKQWRENTSHPRRANVSAYGFGGADYSIALEEFRPEFLKKTYAFSKPAEDAKNSSDAPTQEIVLFSGSSIEEINESYRLFVEENIEGSDFEQLVFNNNSSVSAKKEYRLAICACSMDELKDKYHIFEDFINENKSENFQALYLKGIYFGKGEAVSPDKVAWMFPGQASQYPNMLEGIYERYPQIESFYMQADAVWKSKYGYEITSLVFGDDEERLQTVLKDTKNTHPAMFLSNIAMYKLLSESGIKADYMIGHSLGEITALHASGMLDLKSALRLIGERGFAFDGIPEEDRGIMMSIKADRLKVEELIKESGLKVSVANINSPDQTVVGGREEQISKMTEALERNKITYSKLNVSHAFHTELVSGAAESYYEKIKDMVFDVPKAHVMACHRKDFYPEDKEKMKKVPSILKEQIVSSVNFTESVLKLYEKGVRIFVEAGPSSVLTNLVKNILQGKDVKVVASNNKRKNPVDAYKQALAELFAYGMDVSVLPSGKALKYSKGMARIVDETCNFQAEVKAPIEVNVKTSKSSEKESIVYSGASAGLPGTFKKVFSDDNFDLLFEGKNLIERLTDDEANSILDLNITRLLKTEAQTTFKRLSSINEVIQLAGKLGKIDMLNDYQIDEKALKQMTMTVCAGVAAGYEALKDAGIPLVREQIRTSTGSYLPGRLVLPEHMQDDTGIIFANGFFPVESCISEVSKYVASRFGSKTRNDLLDFYESVISKVSDYSVKKYLTDWFNLHYSRLMYNSGEEEIYEFNHDFLALLCSQANNRLAQFIGAMGPNFFLSAACSSTITAVTVAEDLIRAGHARRMIVIGAENITSKTTLPWSAASFLSMGSLTISPDLFEAAVPFDNRRNGMILGAGAVGLVIEKESDVAERGMNGICRILGTHVFNTAGHQSKIDSNKFSVELDRFMTKMEEEYGFDRKNIAKRTVYYSHETFSPRNGGCANAEKATLETAFGSSFRDIKVINTKGLTGHTMGASIEEAVAAKALQYQKIPPIANFREPDPDLEGLNLSEGGLYSFDYVIRMVTGYGAQGNYHLLQKIATGDERIFDREAYQRWLDKITASRDAKLGKCGRILVAEGTEGKIEQPAEEFSFGNGAADVLNSKPKYDMNAGVVASSSIDKPQMADKSVVDEILGIYSEITRYPKDMLDLNMEVEADLGIDTVKQATILSIISEKFNIPQEDTIKLSNYPTIGHVVSMVQARYSKEASFKQESTPVGVKNDVSLDNRKTESIAAKDVQEEVFKVISEITKYPVEILERNMEMEADLGIDTVKQATIFSILSEKFNIGENGGNISQYKTVGSIVDLVNESQKSKSEESSNLATGIINSDAYDFKRMTHKTQSSKEGSKVERNKTEIGGTDNEKDIEAKVLEVISEITKYPAEMLERDMEMEADLGIDTVKQATIVSLLSDRFDIGKDERINISDYKTIGGIIDLVKGSFKKAESSYEEVKGEVAAVESVDDEDIYIDRNLCLQIPVFVEEKAMGTDFELKDKRIWVIGDNSEQVQKVSQYFAKLCAGVEEFLFADFCDGAELEKKVSDFLNKNQKVDAIVDCTHLGTVVDFDKISESEQEKMLFFSSEARFIFYKALSQKFTDPEIRIVSAVSMDGCHGYAQEKQIGIDPFYGAVSGLYKGLRKEWSKSVIRIVDLGSNKGSPLNNDDLLSLAQEMENKCDEYEIGYCDGKRGVIKLKNLDRNSFKQMNIPEDAHFVITGGGNGITSEITRGLSQRFKGKYTIIGRTELLDDTVEISEGDEASVNNIKLEIQKRLEKTNERVTPVMVQKEYDRLVKSNSIKRLIESIKKDGNSGVYLSCDIRNYEELKKALDKAVQENGPVHVLIHGAGVEKSRLLTQKETEEFKEIFSVKAKGLCNLYRILDRKELKIAIAFSSISGRFGNEAQIDYCAANSFINSFMSMLGNTHKDIYSLSLAWSGWKDVGMAWRNEFIKINSEEMGLHLIEPERGTDEFINILTGGLDSKEVVISRGLGALANNRAADENLDDRPMIDWIAKKDGRIEKVFKVVSVKRDAIFDHHRLGTVPLAPAVAFMELGAETLSLISGKDGQCCFRNVSIDKPLKLFHEEPKEVIVLVNQKEGTESFDMKSYTYLNSRFGVSRFIGLNSMNVSSNLGEYSHLLEMMKIENEPMEEGFTAESLRAFLQKNSNSINLGTLFVDEKKENNVYRRNKNGAIFSMLLPEEELINKKYNLDKLLINPAFADSIFQVCGVHSQFESDVVYLPWQVEEFGIVKVPKEMMRYKAYSILKHKDDEIKVYDAIMVNEKNEVCYYAKNVRMRVIHS
ncbi:type I polyketide synthase [Acetivibrio mesophilus]|uniref:SDR family NAD(P)-dependent oxidoreductase n=1 Tax=Acetivibrio mesophilus TaxID=2487273 RepID=A0A4Q0I4G3_9FIRM|nr:type I polyketide synthase [Acetivibrio mesophilus]RXE59184.1 SDR family NAD(P)-dependent oxidoreductase [Acetivibrio mesophilus]